MGVNGVRQTGQRVVVSLSLRSGDSGSGAVPAVGAVVVVSLSLRGGGIGGVPGVFGAVCGDLDDLLGRVEVQGGEQVALGFGGFGGLAEGAGGAGEGDQVQPLKVGADGRPGAVGGGLGDADEQQREPAEQDVGADAVFEAVVDRSQVDDLFQVTPAAFDFEELLVAAGDVGG